MWSTGLQFSHTFRTLNVSWCYFCLFHCQRSQLTDFDCDDMSLPKRRKIRTFALLFCVITFTTFLFSYTFRDPSLYFFKYAFRLSDNFFSKGPCACRQCMTELEDDPWFAEHFNQSIHPLMTRENSALSDETFKWWQVRIAGCIRGDLWCYAPQNWKEINMHIQLLRADDTLKRKIMNKEQRLHTAAMLPRSVCFCHIDCFKSKGSSAGSSCEAKLPRTICSHLTSKMVGLVIVVHHLSNYRWGEIFAIIIWMYSWHANFCSSACASLQLSQTDLFIWITCVK